MEQSIRLQIGENATNGVYGVFVNHQDYYDAMLLGESKNPNQNQKMYAVVWENSIEHVSLEERRAFAELLTIAEDEGVTIDLSK